MDEFAQTRGGDDLFDDDFTPIADSDVLNPDPLPQRPQTQLFERNKPAPRGRGDRAHGSFSRQQRSQHKPAAVEPQTSITSDTRKEKDSDPPVDADQSNLSQQEPLTPQNKQSTAVRGDRTATGGTPKPKLTEEELTVRLAAVKLNNAKRAEAHRLAEADEASFQQREENASHKRREEGQAKRVMNMEREKNRLRKLGAQAGREWDEGKEEVDKREERGSQYRRGAHGGVVHEGGRGERGGASRRGGYNHQNGGYIQEDQETRGGFRGRNRGGRGDRGRGKGRGGFNPNNSTPQAAPDPVADFPALPMTSKSAHPDQLQPSDTALSPAAAGSSWADEVQAAKAPESGW